MRKAYIFCSQYSLVAYSSLSRAKALEILPLNVSRSIGIVFVQVLLGTWIVGISLVKLFCHF